MTLVPACNWHEKLEIPFKTYGIRKNATYSLTAKDSEGKILELHKKNFLAGSYFNFSLLVFLIKYLYHKENLDSDVLLGKDATYSSVGKYNQQLTDRFFFSECGNELIFHK